MACNNYRPKFQDQINTYDPLGPLNCTCYSGAMAADYHTCGAKVPTGERVRELTYDTSGGTTLPQVDSALRRGWNVDLDTRIGSSRLTWDQFAAKIDAGRGAILQGSYKVIHGTRFQGDANFQGNHAMFILPGWVAMDPLCDGRRPGIYKYNGEAYPRDLLKRFAGALEITPGNRLGVGLAWAALTKDNKEIWRFYLYPEQGKERRYFRRYKLDYLNRITDFDIVWTGGFSATCTSPRLYNAKPGVGLNFKNKSLVRLTSGSRSGWYVSSEYAKEI